MRVARVRLARFASLCLVAACLAIVGCTRIPGRPGPGPEVVRPDEILDFAILYKANCSACHGESGKNGAAISLANPVYLSLVGEDNLRKIVAQGVSGKLMPPFAKSAGGMLTDRQINVLAHGVMQQWSRPDMLAGLSPPPYRAVLQGDVTRGQQTFGEFCARCHGVAGEGSTNAVKSGAGRWAPLSMGRILL